MRKVIAALGLFGIAAVSFYIGYATGMHEVKTSTVVRVGSPLYTAGPYFGECAKIDGHTACATDYPPWAGQEPK